MTHPVDLHVGQKMKTLRILRGLSQTDVANGLGISFQQVQKYELGRNRVSASRLYDIARILVVTPTYFFAGLADTGPGGPVIDDTTARLAARIAQISSDKQRSLIMTMVDSVIDLQPDPAQVAA